MSDSRLDERAGDWIQLVSGKPFWPLDPRQEEITVEDIAHALSMLCRYGGHCTRFYSVAEHSVLASRLVPAEHALWALLHDATEAYLVDLPRPLKRCIPQYREIEDRLEECVAERFGLPWPMPSEVIAADNTMLHTERAALMMPSELEWNDLGESADLALHCWSPTEAREAFLRRYADLTAPTETCTECGQDHGGLIPWHTIEPKDAVHLNLAERLDIDAPRNEEGERCPWPWGPQQLVGAPIGQHHCQYCGAMVMAGMPHLDYAPEVMAEMNQMWQQGGDER